jgi:uncharacterized Zn finger protein (UPF0148 family)
VCSIKAVIVYAPGDRCPECGRVLVEREGEAVCETMHSRIAELEAENAIIEASNGTP